MTIVQIQAALLPQKEMSVGTLYSYLRRLKIEPVGIRQCPQHYPANTPRRILAALGLPHRNRTRRAA